MSGSRPRPKGFQSIWRCTSPDVKMGTMYNNATLLLPNLTGRRVLSQKTQNSRLSILSSAKLQPSSYTPQDPRTAHTRYSFLFTMASAAENMNAVVGFTKERHNDTYGFISPDKADLSGKSVLIAGASKGLGKATALSFAAAGCSKIAIGARSDLSSLEHDIKQAASNAGRKSVPKVISLKMDVTSEASVKEAAAAVTKEFGGALDVLICNAGYLEEWRPFTEHDSDEWWKTWEINIKGTQLCVKHFMPLLLKSDLKTTILTSSVGGLIVRPGASAYQTTKFAVCRLAEFIDAEYSDQGHVCLAIHPGGVKTELALNMPEDMHAVLVDEPELSADTITWLCKENRPWLSGRFLAVNWDMQELESRKDEVVNRDLFKFRMTT
ncbi:hypothetical protein GGR56DRAFT_625483 [Xylariaceae sp. FL0804]|nr:hypothetical protein GGR56DRAFT_625483 [Xylariaceae sp. FL0804]